MRLIDAERLKADVFKASMDEHFMPMKLLDCDTVTEMIDTAPTIEERKTGKWIWVGDETYRDYSTGNATYKCSLCYHTDLRSRTQKVPYCWRCGARMEASE